MLWLEKMDPMALGVRAAPVESISNRGHRLFLWAFAAAKASTFPPTAEIIPPRAANSSHACLTEGVFPVLTRAQIR